MPAVRTLMIENAARATYDGVTVVYSLHRIDYVLDGPRVRFEVTLRHLLDGFTTWEAEPIALDSTTPEDAAAEARDHVLAHVLILAGEV